MTRKDFIFTLYNNGDGLTLDQIERIEQNIIPDIIPDGVIEEIGEETAKNQARDVFMGNLYDQPDMLALRTYIKSLFETDPIILTDRQTYGLFYAVGGIE